MRARRASACRATLGQPAAPRSPPGLSLLRLTSCGGVQDLGRRTSPPARSAPNSALPPAAQHSSSMARPLLTRHDMSTRRRRSPPSSGRRQWWCERRHPKERPTSSCDGCLVAGAASRGRAGGGHDDPGNRRVSVTKTLSGRDDAAAAADIGVDIISVFLLS